VDAELGIYLTQYVHVVWHYFQLDDFSLQLGHCLVDDLLQTYIHTSHQYRTPVLGAPDNVVLAGINDITVAPVSNICSHARIISQGEN
jgi:hypothetical protein